MPLRYSKPTNWLRALTSEKEDEDESVLGSVARAQRVGGERARARDKEEEDSGLSRLVHDYGLPDSGGEWWEATKSAASNLGSLAKEVLGEESRERAKSGIKEFYKEHRERPVARRLFDAAVTRAKSEEEFRPPSHISTIIGHAKERVKEPLYGGAHVIASGLSGQDKRTRLGILEKTQRLKEERSELMGRLVALEDGGEDALEGVVGRERAEEMLRKAIETTEARLAAVEGKDYTKPTRWEDAAESVREWAEEGPLRPDPEFESALGTEIMRGVGSLGTFLGIGGTFGAAAKLLGAGNKLRAGAQTASVMPLATSAGIDEAYRLVDAFSKQHPELDIDEEFKLFTSRRGNIGGAIQVAHVGFILRPIVGKTATTNTMRYGLQRMVEAGISEFTVENSGGIWQNILARSYNPEHPIFEMVPERGMISGTGAAALQAFILPMLRKGRVRGNYGRGYGEGEDGTLVGEQSWNEVLGVPPNASQEQVQEAHKRASALFHPDRVEESERERASEQQSAINKARDIGMRVAIDRTVDAEERGMWDVVAEAKKAGVPLSRIREIYYQHTFSEDSFEKVVSDLRVEINRRTDPDTALNETVADALEEGVEPEVILAALEQSEDVDTATRRLRLTYQPDASVEADTEAVEPSPAPEGIVGREDAVLAAIEAGETLPAAEQAWAVESGLARTSATGLRLTRSGEAALVNMTQQPIIGRGTPESDVPRGTTEGMEQQAASVQQEAATGEQPEVANDNTEGGRIQAQSAAFDFFYEQRADHSDEDHRTHAANRDVEKAQEKANRFVVPMNLWVTADGGWSMAEVGKKAILKGANKLIATFYPEGGTAEEVGTGEDAPLFQRTLRTRDEFENRIDELFAGERARTPGTRMLDNADILGLLGEADTPLLVEESKVTDERHPLIDAMAWKKIPQWLDNPAAVFESETIPGRYVVVAPELAPNGRHIEIILEPKPEGHGKSVSLAVSAYDAVEQRPIDRWLNKGLLRYYDRKRAGVLGEAFQSKAAGLLTKHHDPNKRVLQRKSLNNYRNERGLESDTYDLPGILRQVKSDGPKDASRELASRGLSHLPVEMLSRLVELDSQRSALVAERRQAEIMVDTIKVREIDRIIAEIDGEMSDAMARAQRDQLLDMEDKLPIEQARNFVRGSLGQELEALARQIVETSEALNIPQVQVEALVWAESKLAEEDPLAFNRQVKRGVVKSAHEMFSDVAWENWRKPRQLDRQKVIDMPINDFLKMAEGIDVPVKPAAAKALAEGTKFEDIPFLMFDNEGEYVKVAGHEGRHRAMALRDAGYTHMPVRLWAREAGKGETIRWSEQDSPESDKYVAQWPSMMQSEDGGSVIAFPVLRSESTAPYAPAKARWDIDMQGMVDASAKIHGIMRQVKEAGVTKTPAFKRWFKDSKVVDEQGNPLVMYHGSGADFNIFEEFAAIFFTPDALEASEFADANAYGSDGNAVVYPVYLSVKNPFDPRNPDHVRQVAENTVEAAEIATGYFDALSPVLHLIHDAGFDGFYEKETDTSTHWNIGVFRSEQIKSAVGNVGTFDESDPNIMRQVKEADVTKTPAFKKWFGDSVVVDEDGKPLVVYHGTSGEFDTFEYGEFGFHFGSEEQASGARGSVLMPVYLSLQNPFEFNDDLQVWNDVTVGDYLLRNGVLSEDELRDIPNGDINQWLIDQGYDGYTYPNMYEGEGLSYAVFRPEQIKSAIGNIGTFDPLSPNIMRQVKEAGVTKTPAFRRWHAGSVVKDVVYHGTTETGIEEFTMPAFFTANPSEASAYTFSSGLGVASRLRGKYVGATDPSLEGKSLPFTGIISDIPYNRRDEAWATEQGVVRFRDKDKGPIEILTNLVVKEGSLSDDHQTIRVEKGDGQAALDFLQRDTEDFIKQRGFDEGIGGNVMPVYLSIKNPLRLHPFEANKLGARLGAMTPEQVKEQIAKWEAEGYDGIITTSDEAALIPELAEGQSTEQYIVFRPEQVKSAVGNVGTFDPTTGNILAQRLKEIDNRSEFEAAAASSLAQLSWEAIPSPETGLLPGIFQAPMSQRAEYQEAISKALSDANGNDFLAQWLGLDQAGYIMGPAAWARKVGVGQQQIINLPRDESGRVPQDYIDAMDSYASIIGLMMRQDAVAWHQPHNANSKDEANGVVVELPHNLTTAQAQTFYDVVYEIAGRVTGNEDVGVAFAPIPSMEGFRVLNHEIENTVFHDIIREALERSFGGEVGMRLFASQGDLIGNNWQVHKDGEGYRQRISEAGRPDVSARAGRVLYPRVLETNRRFSRQYNWGNPEGRRPRFSYEEPQVARAAAAQQRRGRRAVSAPPSRSPALINQARLVPRARMLAATYMAEQGLPDSKVHDEYVELDEARAREIARAFDEMAHEPTNTRVLTAYEAFAEETLRQFEFLQRNGVTFDVWTQEGQPYASSYEMLADIRDNNHLYFFPTEAGFGQEGSEMTEDHPLLRDSGVTLNGRKLVFNDLFRAVHDYFGHSVGGYAFGPRGEENAWRSHGAMYSELARAAMTTETRGQNNWVNYGAHGEANRSNPVGTVYADQKVGLLPERFWTWEATDTAPSVEAEEIPIRGMPYDHVVLLAKRISDGMPGAPTPYVARDRNSLPVAVYMALKNVDGLGNTPGLYVPSDAQPYIAIIAENIDNERMVIEAIVHESVGHHGLRMVLGDKYDAFMDAVIEAFPTEVRRAAARNDITTPERTWSMLSPTMQRRAAEEVFAYRAQDIVDETAKMTTKQRSIIQKIIDAIRSFLIGLRGGIFDAVGRRIKIKQSDIDHIIAKAAEYVRNNNFVYEDASGAPMRMVRQGVFYSKMAQVIDSRIGNINGRKQLIEQINSWVKKGGIKAEELHYSGLLAWLEGLDSVQELVQDVGEENLTNAQREHYNDIYFLPGVAGEYVVFIDGHGNPVDYTRTINADWEGITEDKIEAPVYTNADAMAMLKRDHPQRLERVGDSDAGLPWTAEIRNVTQEQIDAAKARGKKTLDKITKSAVMKYLEVNGTRVSIHDYAELGVEEGEDIESQLHVLTERMDFYKESNYEVEFDTVLYDEILEERVNEVLADEDMLASISEEYAELSPEERRDFDVETLRTEISVHFAEEVEQDIMDMSDRRYGDVVEHNGYSEDYTVTINSEGAVDVYAHGEARSLAEWENISLYEAEHLIARHFYESHPEAFEEGAGKKWAEYSLFGQDDGVDYREYIYHWENPEYVHYANEIHWNRADETVNYIAHNRLSINVNVEVDGKDYSSVFSEEMQADFASASRDVLDKYSKAASYLGIEGFNAIKYIQDEVYREKMEPVIKSLVVDQEGGTSTRPKAVDNAIAEVDSALEAAIDENAALSDMVGRFMAAAEILRNAFINGKIEDGIKQAHRLYDGAGDGSVLHPLDRTRYFFVDALHDYYSTYTAESISTMPPITKQAVKWMIPYIKNAPVQGVYKHIQWENQGRGSSNSSVTGAVSFWNEMLLMGNTDVGDKHINALRESSNKVYLTYESAKNLESLTEQADSIVLPPLLNSWPVMTFKHMVALAVAEGKDVVAWSNGDVHGYRWSGLTNVAGVAVVKNNDDMFMVKGVTKNKEGDEIWVDESDLWAYIGRDGYEAIKDELGNMPVGEEHIFVATGEERLRTAIARATKENGRPSRPIDTEQVNAHKVHSLNQFRVSRNERGYGNRKAYDEVYVNKINRFLRPYGLKVASGTLDNAGSAGYEAHTHAVLLNDKIKAQSLEGFPLFTRKERNDNENDKLSREANGVIPPFLRNMDPTANTDKTAGEFADTLGEQTAEEIRAGTGRDSFLVKVRNELKDWRNAPDLPSVEDLGWYSRNIAHPRTIAALFEDFVPVWKSREAKFERRDQMAKELAEMVMPYLDLPTEVKAKVDLLLQEGRLAGVDYSETIAIGRSKDPNFVLRLKNSVDDVSNNQGEKWKFGEYMEFDVVEQNAYIAVRRTFDRQLGLLREQILSELGYGKEGDPWTSAELKADLEARKEELNEYEVAHLEWAAEKVEDIERAHRTGYVPFKRYGDMAYAVIGPSGETAHSERQPIKLMGKKIGKKVLKGRLNRRAQELKKEYPENKGYHHYGWFDVGKKVFREKELVMSDLDALAELGDMQQSTWDMVRGNFELALKKRGFRAQLVGANNVPGWSLDFERAISDSIMGFANYMAARSTRDMADAAIDMIDEAKQPHLKKYAMDYVEYTDSPQEEHQRKRMLTFVYYIAGNISSALVNSTQVFVLTAPYASQFTNMANVFKEISVAYIDAIKMLRMEEGDWTPSFIAENAPQDVREGLMKAWNSGLLVPRVSLDQMGVAAGEDRFRRGADRAFMRTSEAVSTIYTAQERLNRIVTYIAGERLARNYKEFVPNMMRVLQGNALWRYERAATGEPSPYDVAKWLIDETHFRLGKINRGRIFRKEGTLIFQFWSFTMNAVEAMYKMGMIHGPDGRRALAYVALILWFFSGILGLPFMENMKELYEAIAKKLKGHDVDLESDFRMFFAELSPEYGDVTADILLRGPFRTITGMDVSRRVGLGNFLPVRTATRGEVGHALGVPYDMYVGRPLRAIDHIKNRQYMLAASEGIPNFVKNPVQGMLWAEHGVRTNNRLIIPPEQITTKSVVSKIIGFQPTDVSIIREREWAATRAAFAARELQSRYTVLAAYYIMNEPEKLQSLFIDIERYNSDKPEYLQVHLTQQGIRRAAEQEVLGAASRDKRRPRRSRDTLQDLRNAWPRTTIERRPSEAETEAEPDVEDAEELEELDLSSMFRPMTGQRKAELAASFRDNGEPRVADLVASIPNRPSQKAIEALMRSAKEFDTA